jgi:predicted NAD/FAD-dependent oxidoreductase
MRRIPEALADGLDVRSAVTVDRLEAVEGKVAAVVGEDMAAVDIAVILTPPVPRTRSLLEVGGAALPDRVAEMLDRVEYDRCCDLGFPVVIAGEVFSGARAEGAYTSGVAAASQVLEDL